MPLGCSRLGDADACSHGASYGCEGKKRATGVNCPTFPVGQATSTPFHLMSRTCTRIVHPSKTVLGSAQAGFVFFTTNPANLNERALVGEQIFLVPGGSITNSWWRTLGPSV